MPCECETITGPKARTLALRIIYSPQFDLFRYSEARQVVVHNINMKNSTIIGSFRLIYFHRQKDGTMSAIYKAFMKRELGHKHDDSDSELLSDSTTLLSELLWITDLDMTQRCPTLMLECTKKLNERIIPTDNLRINIQSMPDKFGCRYSRILSTTIRTEIKMISDFKECACTLCMKLQKIIIDSSVDKTTRN